MLFTRPVPSSFCLPCIGRTDIFVPSRTMRWPPCPGSNVQPCFCSHRLNSRLVTSSQTENTTVVLRCQQMCCVDAADGKGLLAAIGLASASVFLVDLAERARRPSRNHAGGSRVPAAPSCESRPRSSRGDASSRLDRDSVRAVGARSTRGDYCSSLASRSRLLSHMISSRLMARRHEDWNVGLAEDLRDSEFAREFLLGAIEEEVPLQVALGKVVRAMGVKEFAAKVGMASPNLLRTLNPRHNPTQETLNRLLKPFRLKLSLAPISARPKRRRTA